MYIHCMYLRLSFDEDAETDELFTWHKVQVEHNKFQQFKEFVLKTEISHTRMYSV